MLKKVILSYLVLATTSTMVYAAGNTYIGGSMGLTHLEYSQSNHVNAGAVGKLFGGYGTTVGVNNQFYLGGEFNIDRSYSHNNTHPNSNAYVLGASIIPGLLLTNDTMLYTRLGLQANRVDNTGNSIQFGNQLGLGLQTKISPKWAIRTEYINLSNIANKHDNQLLLGLVYHFDFL